MTEVYDLSRAHLRVARPSDDLEALVRFYRDGLGFSLPVRQGDIRGPRRLPRRAAKRPLAGLNVFLSSWGRTPRKPGLSRGETGGASRNTRPAEKAAKT
jgi:hypothetical protein